MKSQSKAQNKRPVIEIIDLTSDNDEPETNPKRSHVFKTPDPGARLIKYTPVQEATNTAPSPLRRLIPTLSGASAVLSRVPGPKSDPDILDSFSIQRDTTPESNKLRPINQEWAAHFRRRIHERNRSPTKQAARRRSTASRIQRAKRPIIKAKSLSRGSISTKSVLRSRDVYEDFETESRPFQGSTPVDNKCLLRQGFCPDICMDDLRDFDKQDEAFEQVFDDTLNKVLASESEDATNEVYFGRFR
jgi:hypothetical protein